MMLCFQNHERSKESPETHAIVKENSAPDEKNPLDVLSEVNGTQKCEVLPKEGVHQVSLTSWLANRLKSLHDCPSFKLRSVLLSLNTEMHFTNDFFKFGIQFFPRSQTEREQIKMQPPENFVLALQRNAKHTIFVDF